MQFYGGMDFIIDYFEWGEFDGWYFFPGMRNEGSCEAVSQFLP
jgi:hypothetical protein